MESFMRETKSKYDVPKRRDQVMELVQSYLKSLQLPWWIPILVETFWFYIWQLLLYFYVKKEKEWYFG